MEIITLAAEWFVCPVVTDAFISWYVVRSVILLVVAVYDVIVMDPEKVGVVIIRVEAFKVAGVVVVVNVVVVAGIVVVAEEVGVVVVVVGLVVVVVVLRVVVLSTHSETKNIMLL